MMEAIRRFITTNPVMGIIYGLISTIAFALAHFFAQMVEISSEEVPKLEMVFMRCILQLFLLLPFLLMMDTQILYPSDKWLQLGIMTITGYTGYITIYFCLNLIPLSVILTLTSTCPFFATIFSYFILKERCSWLDALCGVVSFLGVLLITRPMAIFGKYGKKEHVFYENVSATKYELIYLSGCALAILFGIQRALYLVYARQWKNQYTASGDQMIPVFYPTVLGCVLTPTIMLLKGDDLALPEPLFARCALFGFGILTTIGLMGLTLAVKTQNATVVGLLRNLEIIWAFLLQAVSLKIDISALTITGSFVIVLSTVIGSFRKKILKKTDACCLRKNDENTDDEEQKKLVEDE